jgi:coenzyme PQQ precursor peptide PqqA
MTFHASLSSLAPVERRIETPRCSIEGQNGGNAMKNVARKTWSKPRAVEVCVGMEVSSYESAKV